MIEMKPVAIWSWRCPGCNREQQRPDIEGTASPAPRPIEISRELVCVACGAQYDVLMPSETARLTIQREGAQTWAEIVDGENRCRRCKKRVAENQLHRCDGPSAGPSRLAEPYVQPPLGVLREKLWLEQRLWDLGDAFHRYRMAGKDVPVVWIDEISRRAGELAEIMSRPKP